MALMWLILEFMVAFMFWNLPPLKVEIELEKQKLLNVSQNADTTTPPSSGNVTPDQSNYSINNKSNYSAVLQPEEVHSESIERSISIPSSHQLLSSGDEANGIFTSSNEMIENAEWLMSNPSSRHHSSAENSIDKVEISSAAVIVPNSEETNCTQASKYGSINENPSQYCPDVETVTENTNVSWRYYYNGEYYQ